MNKRAKDYLDALNLDSIQVILLADEETENLLNIKDTRSPREYCWTITPFVFDFVFRNAPDIKRLTYLDADLFFFKSPRLIFAELEDSGKDILITRHAFDDRYDRSRDCGEFCVQFVTVNNTKLARNVIRHWQRQCLDWCYDIIEPERFGDQKYLDAWPRLYGDLVHVLEQESLALGPWNSAKFDRLEGAEHLPVFYHFHGVRFPSKRWVLLCKEYEVTRRIKLLYKAYVQALKLSLDRLYIIGYTVHISPITSKAFPMIKFYKKLIKRKILAARI
jgi:hypothetical protein